MKQNENNIMVTPINKDKVLAMIADRVKLNENQAFVIDLHARVGNNVMTDNECVYHFMDKRYHNGKVQLIYDVPVRIKTKTDNGWRHGITVDFYFPIPVEELDVYSDKEISLREYMGSRYNYNPRIKNNMREFIIDVGSQLEIEA